MEIMKKFANVDKTYHIERMNDAYIDALNLWPIKLVATRA